MLNFSLNIEQPQCQRGRATARATFSGPNGFKLARTSERAVVAGSDRASGGFGSVVRDRTRPAITALRSDV